MSYMQFDHSDPVEIMHHIAYLAHVTHELCSGDMKHPCTLPQAGRVMLPGGTVLIVSQPEATTGTQTLDHS